MNNKTNESIVSRDLSRELLKQLRAARRKSEKSNYSVPLAPLMPMRGRYGRIMLQTKWAWRWNGCAYCGHNRHLEYTEGVSLTANMPQPGYGGLGMSKTWRLRPGWTVAEYDRMVYRATTWAIQQLRAIEYREQVHDTFENMSQVQRDAAVQFGEKNNLSPIYAEMSIEDCEKWLDYIKTVESTSSLDASN